MQDVTSWLEVVISALRSLMLPLVHVPLYLRKLWKDRDLNTSVLVTVTKGSPAKNAFTGASLSKGLCTLC